MAEMLIFSLWGSMSHGARVSALLRGTVWAAIASIFVTLRSCPLKPLPRLGLKWRGLHSLETLIDWKHYDQAP
jgi:hypothetical protein